MKSRRYFSTFSSLFLTWIFLNSLPPSVPYMARLAKILIKKKGIMEKIPMSAATMSR